MWADIYTLIHTCTSTHTYTWSEAESQKGGGQSRRDNYSQNPCLSLHIFTVMHHTPPPSNVCVWWWGGSCVKIPGESEWSLICLPAHQVLDEKQVEEKRVNVQGDLDWITSFPLLWVCKSTVKAPQPCAVRLWSFAGAWWMLNMMQSCQHSDTHTRTV